MTDDITDDEIERIKRDLRDSQPYSRDIPNSEVRRLATALSKARAEQLRLAEQGLQQVLVEREECAKLAETYFNLIYRGYGKERDVLEWWQKGIAEAIRKR